MSTPIQNAYEALKQKAQHALAKQYEHCKVKISVGSATCENAAGADDIAKTFQQHITATKRSDVIIKRVGCTGRCSREPIVLVEREGQAPVIYEKVTPDKAYQIFVSHIIEDKPVTEYLLDSQCEKAFYCGQTRIALRNIGLVEPLNIYEYIEKKGFSALAQVLSQNNKWVVEEIKKSKLRGRGGAGFPTGMKWEYANMNEEKQRYMVCNGDEGDPGAFMDRSVLESDPYSVIEGMIIAGYAIQAQHGYFYIRAEYPMAVDRIQKAIEICRTHGLVGKNILNSGFNFDLEIRFGAGAFVCGEETALIQSIEGKRGQPRIRPPFPAQKGLWGKPTVINNVETLANIPAILQMGAEKFAKMGTEKSGGTKVFALAGKIKNTGLVEVPMGTPLRKIIYELGGGILNDKKLKAVQTGGPAGGMIPAASLDIAIDYETLGSIGSIMGSGGMIVLDEDTCMVDMAKFFVTFTQDESCGKCTPCREGTRRMLEILQKITAGKGTLEDLPILERLATLVKKSSLCGLGKAAPNPVLSSLKHFKDEYVAHVVEKRCPAKRCLSLMRYEIDPNKCVGCTVCAKNCPVQCISGVRKEPHSIDQKRCVKCGQCFAVCRFGAVQKI
jgi:NADH:ubiquinone oxidoreductase subunit F (NADH-binding)/(2Fe-2S) ferredoxin